MLIYCRKKKPANVYTACSTVMLSIKSKTEFMNKIHVNLIYMKTKHRTLKKYLVKLLKYIFSQTNKCLQMNYTNYTN